MLERASRLLFQPPDGSRSARLFSLVATPALYMAGVLHWLIFFLTDAKSFGLRVMTFSAYQWPREFVFLSTLQEAIQRRVIPYHISPAVKETTRFLGIPDYVLSPQILLLDRLDLATFVLVNTILLYSVSFLTCLRLKSKYKLAWIPFTFLFLLFNFNGNITAQIGAGHYVWAGFFLLPLYCLLVLELLESVESEAGVTWLWAVKMALLWGVTILQGTYHFYTWGIMFLALVALFHRRYRRPVIAAVLLSLPVVAVRVVPAALTFGGLGERSFLSGYVTVEHFLEGLLFIRPHSTTPIGTLANLSWWEYDFYIGIVGVALIAYFGLYLAMRPRADLAALRYQALDWPLAVMTGFAFSFFFAPIANLPIPLLSAERVSSRFVIIPLLLLILVSVLRLNALLPNLTRTLRAKVIAIASVALLGASLAQHTSTWRVAVLEADMPQQVDIGYLQATYTITTQSDPLYLTLVPMSAAVSVLSFSLLLGAWLWASWRNRPRPQDNFKKSTLYQPEN